MTCFETNLSYLALSLIRSRIRGSKPSILIIFKCILQISHWQPISWAYSKNSGMSVFRLFFFIFILLFVNERLPPVRLDFYTFYSGMKSMLGSSNLSYDGAKSLSFSMTTLWFCGSVIIEKSFLLNLWLFFGSWLDSIERLKCWGCCTLFLDVVMASPPPSLASPSGFSASRAKSTISIESSFMAFWFYFYWVACGSLAMEGYELTC